MGVSQSVYRDQPLYPLNPPIGCFDPNKFVQQFPVTFFVSENMFSFSGDDFKIRDLAGNTLFKCDGAAFSLRQRKTLIDALGMPFAVIERPIFSFNQQYTVKDANTNRKIVDIQREWSFTKCKFTVGFMNSITGQAMTLYCKGNFLGRELYVFHGDPKQGGVLLGRVTRSSFDMRQAFFNVQQYWVECSPGLDYALMCCICIVFDEMKNDQKR